MIVTTMILGVFSSQNILAQEKPKKANGINSPPNQITIRLPPKKINDAHIHIRNGILFDGLALIGESPIEAEKMLGKAVEVEAREITPDSLALPGRNVFVETRHYKVSGEKFINYTLFGLSVRFLNGKAVGFDLDLPQPQETPAAAMALVGIDVTGKKDFALSSATAKYWRDKFNGKYLTVAATRFGSKVKLYNLVEVRLYQDDKL